MRKILSIFFFLSLRASSEAKILRKFAKFNRK